MAPIPIPVSASRLLPPTMLLEQLGASPAQPQPFELDSSPFIKRSSAYMPSSVASVLDDSKYTEPPNYAYREAIQHMAKHEG
jgi:hypothetical protein